MRWHGWNVDWLFDWLFDGLFDWWFIRMVAWKSPARALFDDLVRGFR
jgi:hypothetical protein